MPAFNQPSDPVAIQALAVRLWGEVNHRLSTRDELRFGSSGSKSVKPALGVWFDHELHEGGGYRDLYKLVNGAYPENGSDKGGFYVPAKMLRDLGPPAGWWDYHDQHGSVVGRVVRFHPPGLPPDENGKPAKSFRQARPDGAGWAWGMKGLLLPLYQGPSIQAAPAGSLVYLTEGERKADRLRQWGLVATTAAGGAGKFRADHARALAGHTVIALADNDAPGRKHRDGVMRELRAAGVTAHVLDLPDLPEKGDVVDWIKAGGTADELARLTDGLLRREPEAEAKQDTPAPQPGGLVLRRLEPIAPTLLPPRPWAYGNFLLFGSASVIGALDGAGKSAIAIVTALAFITGKPLLGEKVWRTGSVAIVTYEDDELEWQRRIAAACQHYRLDYAAALAGFYFIHKPGGRVSFASMLAGETIYPDSEGIISMLRAIKAAMLIVDPFNHAHTLDDGNSNVMVARVAAEVSRIARAADVAALVLHHLRKGSTGQADDLMGAVSLRATFRSCRILTRMTADEAGTLNVTDPWRHLRISSGKENYAPPPELATWFKLESVSLHNGRGIYPDGDNIGVATAWTPPSPFENLPLPVIAAIFEAIRKGPSDGERFTFTRGGKSARWVGDVIISNTDKTPPQAAAIVATWRLNEVLIEGTYENRDRKERLGVTLNEAKAGEILTPLRPQTGDDE